MPGHLTKAVKLRRNLPLLLERVGVTTEWIQEIEQRREQLPRRIKIRKIFYLLPSSRPSLGGRRGPSFLT
jgi:hypothetical protein